MKLIDCMIIIFASWISISIISGIIYVKIHDIIFKYNIDDKKLKIQIIDKILIIGMLPILFFMFVEKIIGYGMNRGVDLIYWWIFDIKDVDLKKNKIRKDVDLKKNKIRED